MKKLVVLLSTFLAFGALSAQNIPQGYQINEKNVIYKATKLNPEGRQIVEGDVIFGHFSVSINDSIVQDNFSAQAMPTFLVNSKNKAFSGDLMAALPMMKTGEEYTFAFPVDSIKNRVMRIPDGIQGFVYYRVSAEDAMPMEVFMKMEQDKKDALMQAEGEKIQNFVKENGFTDAPVEGVYIKHIIQGEGKQAENSDVVQVHYIGQLLDGTYFDTSVEDVAKENGLYQKARKYEPLEFQIGAGRMIKGFEIAAKQMKQGGKAVVIIPSSLAYGDRDMGVIKPYSPLMFTMELVSVKAGEPLPEKAKPVTIKPTIKTETNKEKAAEKKPVQPTKQTVQPSKQSVKKTK